MPRFRAKPIEFEAVKLRQPIEIRAGKGRPVVRGKTGDWLRVFDDGAQDVVTSAQLDAGFERVNGTDPFARLEPAQSHPLPVTASTAVKYTEAEVTAKLRPSAATPASKRPSKLTDAQWAAARGHWEAGEAATAIAKRFKVSSKAIHDRAVRDGWPKRAKSTNGKVPAAPAGTKLAGRVRCHSCEQMTEYDPCQYCHKPLKKTWT